MEVKEETQSGAASVIVGVVVIVGGLYLIWRLTRPDMPAGPTLEKVAETIKATGAKAGEVVEKVAETVTA